MGWSLNVNEIHRQLVEPAGDAGRLWWNDVHRGDKRRTRSSTAPKQPFTRRAS
jgi:hypothetical protein